LKFKTIFILFNIVIVISFIIIYFMPLLMLGWEYTTIFWSKNWFLPLIFIAVLVLLNSYFLLNWRLFQLLESEDWDKLRHYLEEKIFEKKRFQAQHVRILVNTYLIRSNVDGIKKLEAFLREHNPELLPKFALSLGIPYLLQNDPRRMELYFQEFLHSTKGNDNRWIQWNYSFALLLQRKKEEAKNTLIGLLDQAKDPVLKLLTVYMLDGFSAEADIEEKVRNTKEEFRKNYSPGEWEKEVVKAKGNVEVVILAQLVQDATEWLFSTSSDIGEPDNEVH
jgi:hypothetical protein